VRRGGIVTIGKEGQDIEEAEKGILESAEEGRIVYRLARRRAEDDEAVRLALTILQDADSRATAKALGVGVQQVYEWRGAKDAPRDIPALVRYAAAFAKSAMGYSVDGLDDVDALRRYPEWRDAVAVDCRSVLESMSVRGVKQMLGCSGKVAREARAGRLPHFRTLLRWLPKLGAW
jgi:hypothetical protein